MGKKRDAEQRRQRYLIDKYLRLRAIPHGRRFPGDDGWYELRSAVDNLRQAHEVIEFLRRSGRDPYDTFADIDQTLNNAYWGVTEARRQMDRAGFLHLLDDHLDVVMRSVRSSGLPEDEAAVLEALGFPELATDIEVLVDLLGDEWRSGSPRAQVVTRELGRRSASGALDSAIAAIEQHREERREGRDADAPRDLPEPKKERRWWKGLGQVVQGASIAVADVGMAVGAFKFPVSPETQTYGAVVSVAAGVGTIMNGVGDLWGE